MKYNVFPFFKVVHKKLMACLNHLVPEHQSGAFEANGGTNGGHSMWFPAREASTESLIIGALEAAFWEMDQQIGDDKKRYKMLGKIFFLHEMVLCCQNCSDLNRHSFQVI